MRRHDQIKTGIKFTDEQKEEILGMRDTQPTRAKQPLTEETLDYRRTHGIPDEVVLKSEAARMAFDGYNPYRNGLKIANVERLMKSRSAPRRQMEAWLGTVNDTAYNRRTGYTRRSPGVMILGGLGTKRSRTATQIVRQMEMSKKLTGKRDIESMFSLGPALK